MIAIVSGREKAKRKEEGKIDIADCARGFRLTAVNLRRLGDSSTSAWLRRKFAVRHQTALYLSSI